MGVQAYHSLLAYVSGLGDQSLNRDLLRPEKINFQGFIDAAGAVTQPAQQRVLETFWFVATKLAAYIMDPATNPRDVAKVSAVIQDPAEGRNFFRNAFNFGRIVSPQNGAGEVDLEAPYFLPPGSSIQVTLATDLVTAGAWGGATKIAGVSIEGFLVAESLAAKCGLIASQGG